MVNFEKQIQPQFCQPPPVSGNPQYGFCSSFPCFRRDVYYIHVNSFDFHHFHDSIFTFFPQVIKTQPGRHLAVHYQSISGEKCELHVKDGNTTNATQLMLVNQWTGVNQAVAPSSSSGHELFIKFRFSAGRNDARLKFLITDDQGKNFSHS